MKTAYIDCTAYGHSVLKAHSILDKIPGLHLHVGDPTATELDALMKDTVGIINGHTIMDKALLQRYHALKTIVFLGTGASTYIDLSAAQARGIDVLTVRGYGDRTIAEHAFALMLSATRHIAAMDRELRRGIWRTPIGVELAGKRIGIIGVGGVGKELVSMAHAFGMEVVAWNRSPIPDALPCKQVELNELISTSDVISLHLALNDDTRGIISKQQFALMKQTAILVNVGRGALVDETALIEALKTQRIAHAALDVFDIEPLPVDHELTTLENVTLTAHAAFSSEETMTRLLTSGFDLLRQALDTPQAK